MIILNFSAIEIFKSLCLFQNILTFRKNKLQKQKHLTHFQLPAADSRNFDQYYDDESFRTSHKANHAPICSHPSDAGAHTDRWTGEKPAPFDYRISLSTIVARYASQ